MQRVVALVNEAVAHRNAGVDSGEGFRRGELLVDHFAFGSVFLGEDEFEVLL